MRVTLEMFHFQMNDSSSITKRIIHIDYMIKVLKA